MEIPFPSTSTKATDELCRKIAKKSNGVVLLGFSRGKDSLCAWLQLRRYFSRIIPVYGCNLPHLEIQERALRYYEDVFGEHIIRMMFPGEFAGVKNLEFQLPDDEEFISKWNVPLGLDMNDVMNMVRYCLNLPKAWAAYGINASDSMQRRILVTQRQGIQKKAKSFYPCWDWSHEQIISTVEESGLKVAPEYNFTSRTLGGFPPIRWIEPLEAAYPQDVRKLKLYYPLIWADVMRMTYRHERLKRQREEENKREAESAGDK